MVAEFCRAYQEAGIVVVDGARVDRLECSIINEEGTP